MYSHNIFLSSSYSTGRRIALHLVDPDVKEYRSYVDSIKNAYGGEKRVPFSIHVIVTDSPEWGSVVEDDPYFDDVSIIDNVDDFVELIGRDRYLDGETVARYILSKEGCTHTRLEKLTYMCYADYLCTYGRRLFEDPIYAFTYGPVVDTVYSKYSRYSRSNPGAEIDRKAYVSNYMPVKSRIAFSEDGFDKIRSINETLERYGGYTAEALVDLTHGDHTPWSVTKERSADQYTVIEDSDIVRYHCNERPR